ncbi:WhiB family transcriptional regulator [Mycolicibacterium porcinum]|uniref:WhiB family transcriptional regulator n=1 Tax=Mycolicibacterium porcinum TaxID=39693 RepID=UPI001193E6A4|nr:WhiB family transcriptional regulator [Mycolicibacterium porcinum]
MTTVNALHIAPGDNSWFARAECRSVDAETFFHPEGERGRAREARVLQAKSVCHRCAVIDQCRRYALAYREGFGIWGGMSEDERISIYVANGTRPRGRSTHVANWPVPQRRL